jgi:hypothetical protein
MFMLSSKMNGNPWVRVMVFNAILHNILVISCGSQFYWCLKSEYPKKTTDLP